MRSLCTQFELLKELVGHFREKQDGAIMATYALMLPALLGVVGLGIESGIWYTAKRNVQTQADAAALSGAYERQRGNPSYANVSAAAQKEAIRNGYVNAAPNSIVINNPPKSGANSGDQGSVEIIITEPQNPLFSALFVNSLNVRARSVATVKTTGEACVLALHPYASGAIANQGSPKIMMDGCVMASNSGSDSAIQISGSAIVDADSFWTRGDIAIGGSTTVTYDREPKVNMWALDDPYASLSIDSFGVCPSSNNNLSLSGTQVINPGVYCNGININAGANVTLKPGVYYVDAGDVIIAGTATVRCDCDESPYGVTIILTSSGSSSAIGTIRINGGADVQLKAPTEDGHPYKGILVYQDRRAPVGASAKLTGGSTMLLTGSIYFPKQTVEWSGGNSAVSTCTQIIGREVNFVGNSEIVNTGCEAAGIKPLEIVGVEVTE